MKKAFVALSFLIVGLFSVLTFNAEAYVSVQGYFKSNGTYVAPYVRSNPNGLKYDNYSWTPSQGLYNTSYGTKGSYWDTPTYITDPNYYVGKSIYESNNSKTSPSIKVPTNATLDYYGTGWTCNKGYTKNYTTSNCDKVIIPANATLDYLGTSWTCNSGYKKNYSTNKCDKVAIPANAHLSYLGDDWYCDSGYKENYTTKKCDKVIIPANAHLSYSGDDWYCDSGYKENYATKKCDKI